MCGVLRRIPYTVKSLSYFFKFWKFMDLFLWPETLSYILSVSHFNMNRFSIFLSFFAYSVTSDGNPFLLIPVSHTRMVQNHSIAFSNLILSLNCLTKEDNFLIWSCLYINSNPNYCIQHIWLHLFCILSPIRLWVIKVILSALCILQL